MLELAFLIIISAKNVNTIASEVKMRMSFTVSDSLYCDDRVAQIQQRLQLHPLLLRDAPFPLVHRSLELIVQATSVRPFGIGQLQWRVVDLRECDPRGAYLLVSQLWVHDAQMELLHERMVDEAQALGAVGTLNGVAQHQSVSLLIDVACAQLEGMQPIAGHYGP